MNQDVLCIFSDKRKRRKMQYNVLSFAIYTCRERKILLQLCASRSEHNEIFCDVSMSTVLRYISVASHGYLMNRNHERGEFSGT